ncbi:MAG: hypothetical protein VCE91_00215 [Nitrospinota bacterium]
MAPLYFPGGALAFLADVKFLALTAIALLFLAVFFDVFVSQREKAFFFPPLDSNKIFTTTRIKITSTQGIEPVAQRAGIPSAMMLSLQTINLYWRPKLGIITNHHDITKKYSSIKFHQPLN